MAVAGSEGRCGVRHRESSREGLKPGCGFPRSGGEDTGWSHVVTIARGEGAIDGSVLYIQIGEINSQIKS
jgi:hypothetical protein